MILNFDARALLRSPAFWLCCALLCLLVIGVDPAHASDAGDTASGTGLAWETPLQKVQQSISGPVAFAIALLGIIACGATLIWGGEVTEFVRRIIYLVIVISLIVFANTLLTSTLFSGAMVPTSQTAIGADVAAILGLATQ